MGDNVLYFYKCRYKIIMILIGEKLTPGYSAIAYIELRYF